MIVDIPDGSDISSAEESNDDDTGFEISNGNREKRGVKRKQNENIEWNKGELSDLVISFEEDDAMQLDLFDSKSKPIDIFAYLFSEDLVNELVLQSNLFKHQKNIKNDDVNL